MRALLLVMALIISTGCNHQRPWAEALSSEDNSLLEFRRPKLQIRSFQPHGRDSLLAEDIRRWAEGHQAALTALARSAASESAATVERWDFQGSFGDGSGGIMMSLFGAYRGTRLMAGCKVMMSFDEKRSLTKVFVYEVPLE